MIYVILCISIKVHQCWWASINSSLQIRTKHWILWQTPEIGRELRARLKGFSKGKLPLRRSYIFVKSMPRLVNAARYAPERFRFQRKHDDIYVLAIPHDRSSQTCHFLRTTTTIPISTFTYGEPPNRGHDIYWRPAITEATICHAAVLIT